MILTTLPIPTPNFDAGEHLIKVHTIAPCNGELLWQKNFPPPATTPPKQLLPCDDIAGEVVSAPIASPFQPGTRVYARTSYIRTGNAREYSIGLTDELAIIPKNLNWTNAASVPLSALTAGGLKRKSVLVTAASGSVGIWIVQLAKLAGAEVIGTCGPSNVEFVKSLGADEVLDYRSVDFKLWGTSDSGANKADLVIHCIGGKSLEDAWWCVKEGGELISIYQPPEGKKPEGLDVEVKNFMFIMVPDGKSLSEISELLEKGMVRAVVDSVYPLEDFEKAFAKVASGHARGKVVLSL